MDEALIGPIPFTKLRVHHNDHIPRSPSEKLHSEVTFTEPEFQEFS